MEIKTNMTMTYELITPQEAKELLEKNTNNRKISSSTVDAYCQDLIHDDWTSETGQSISIDTNGVLRDGQHRLEAIIKTGVSMKTWVCRNTDPQGIYDFNRKRSAGDQLSIIRPDLEKIYTSTRYRAVAGYCISRRTRRVITPKEIEAFTDKYKKELDGFFFAMPQKTPKKTSSAVIWFALLLAYMNGVKIEDITDFYEVLTTGMCSMPEEYPIIAYRNHLVNLEGSPKANNDEITKCQSALNNYLKGTCVKQVRSLKELIWDYKF